MPEAKTASVETHPARTTLPVKFFTRTELRAVIRIVEADDYLAQAARPYIDEANVEIDWDRIFSIKFGKAHNAALNIAYAIWHDRLQTGFDPFLVPNRMTRKLQLAVFEALAMKWHTVPEPRKLAPGKLAPSRIVFK